MKNLVYHFTDRYYRFVPGEFMPIYDGTEMLNKREFHLYKLRNWKQTYWQLTHFAG